MKALSAVWQLVRGQNLIFIFAGVWVGGDVGASDFHVLPALVGGMAAMCLGAFGNAVNDIFDRHVDATRKGHRPLPSGRLSPRAARLWAMLFAAVAVCGGFALYTLVGAVVCATLLLLWLYSRLLKGWHGVGHVVIASFSGLVFVFGALAQGESFASVLPQGWSAAVLGFLWHLAREWVKSAEDFEDDHREGVHTLAVRLGSRTVSQLASAALGLLVSLLWVPVAAGWFGMTYLLIAGVAIAPLLIAVAYYLWHNPDRERLGQLSLVLKWAMPLGVVAVWLG
jgi:geranylgeranylglycerol-phosphate geranylgeranyltransferase